MPQVTPRIINPPFAFADLDTEFLENGNHGGPINLTDGGAESVLPVTFSALSNGDLVLIKLYAALQTDNNEASLSVTVRDLTSGGQVSDFFPNAYSGSTFPVNSTDLRICVADVMARMTDDAAPTFEMLLGLTGDTGTIATSSAQIGGFALKST